MSEAVWKWREIQTVYASKLYSGSFPGGIVWGSDGVERLVVGVLLPAGSILYCPAGHERIPQSSAACGGRNR